MKIASIVCTFPPYAGGIGNSAFRINKLLEDKHEITVFTPATIKPWLHYGLGAFIPQLFWKLNKFDYIYLHYPFFGTAEVVWFFKLFFKRPKLIIHYHMDVDGLSPLARLLSWPNYLIRRSLLNQADTIITASFDYIKNSRIKNYYQAHPEKFKEIPFGVDTEKFRPKMADRAANDLIAKAQAIVNYINDKFIKKRRLNILFVGGLDSAHYFKGVEILLNALFLSTNRNWNLKIVGDGNLRPHYEETAGHLKIDNQVEFAGNLPEPELIRAFQEADLFVLPSINRNEAFGLVLIEALACGVPVIASDLPGVRRVFENNKQGLVVEAGDIKDLTKKLEFIFNNENLRKEMAAAARRLAEQKYDLKKIKDRLESLFV